MNRTKELANKTMIITIGRVSTQLISFLLLPLYTSLLTTEEFGSVDLVTTLVQLLVPITSLMVDQATFRSLLKYDDDENRSTIVTSSTAVLLVASVMVVMSELVLHNFINYQFQYWLIVILIATAFSNLFLQIARGLGKTIDYAVGSLVASSVTIVTNVVCIAYMSLGAIGMLIAVLLGNIACTVLLFFRLSIFKYLHCNSFSMEAVKAELRYSLPLVPNQVSVWLMNSSDRIVVTAFLGVSANGILAVSHKFPAIFMTFYNFFLLAWHEVGVLHYRDSDRDAFFSKTVNRCISIFAGACCVIIVSLPLVYDIFINSVYKESYYNVPVYMVASLFNVIVGILGVVYIATEKTGEIAKTTIISAVINIALCVILVKYIGLYAASLSSLASYGVTLIYRMKDTKKYLAIKYNIKLILALSGLLIVCSLIYYYNSIVLTICAIPPVLAFIVYINRRDVSYLFTRLAGIINVPAKRIAVICFTIGMFVYIILSALLLHYHISKPVDVKQGTDIHTQQIEPKQIVKFSEFGERDFTCTGLTYDKVHDSIWVADYGREKNEADKPLHPRIVELDKKLTRVVSQVDLSDVLASDSNLQGIAYDSIDDSFWLAVGSQVVEISRSGNVIKRIKISDYVSDKSNGICIDDNTLYILCDAHYLIHLNKDGILLEKTKINYRDQDQITMADGFLFATIGANYQGNNNFICKIRPSDGEVVALYQAMDSHSVEGICIVEDKVLIANDGLFHSDLMNCSYFTIYESAMINSG